MPLKWGAALHAAKQMLAQVYQQKEMKKHVNKRITIEVFFEYFLCFLHFWSVGTQYCHFCDPLSLFTINLTKHGHHLVSLFLFYFLFGVTEPEPYWHVNEKMKRNALQFLL